MKRADTNLILGLLCVILSHVDENKIMAFGFGLLGVVVILTSMAQRFTGKD